jgi:hypothetical protein
MAEDVTAGAATEAPAEAPLVSGRERRSERARSSSYRFRFGLVYVLLAMLFGAGVGALVVLVSRPAPAPEPQWSAWQPTGSPDAMMRQIADRIPQAYRQNGEQLTVSTASPLAITTEQGQVPIDTVFVTPDTSRGLAEEDDIDTYPGGSVVSYALCGLGSGEQCAITKGKPTTARFTFLRREALELSLYTLKYVDGIDSVIVFMPPSANGQPNGTIFLTRDDVRPELRRPLRELLPTRMPSVGGLSEVEEGHVLRLIEPRTYAYQIQAAPNGAPVLVLSPPSAAATQTP